MKSMYMYFRASVVSVYVGYGWSVDVEVSVCVGYGWNVDVIAAAFSKQE